MRISYDWLGEIIKPLPSPAETAEVLTQTGLEVESLEGGTAVSFDGLVVGEVLSCEKHPNADRLKLTKVNIGSGEPLSIVCGAPNVAAGQRVIVATIGTTLHPIEGDPFTIKESKIRGELSQGMLCAEDEIGIGHSHDGIRILPEHAEPGLSIENYIQKPKADAVFEIGLTPNRSDATGHIGVARDVYAALYETQGLHFQLPEILNINTQPNPVKIEVLNPEHCLRYSALCFKNIRVGESPEWLRQRLEAVGLKSINNVVDITNYVMMETGQPLHAFDRKAIKGQTLKIRVAQANETISTLDGVERKLSTDDLVIADESEALCIAGVYGGLNSGVSEHTIDILLESACFNPTSVRKTSKRLGLKTDSSFRFERGSDINATLYALQRAAFLLKSIAQAETDGGISDQSFASLEKAEITLTRTYLNTLIGETIPDKTVAEILHRLDFDVKEKSADYWKLTIPTAKVDVKRPADVVEEILRIYGFNKIGFPEQLRSNTVSNDQEQKLRVRDKLQTLLEGNGFNEVLNNSLSSAAYYSESDAGWLVKISNPLSSELDVMRGSLLFGLLENVSYNLNRQVERMKLMEWGKVYAQSSEGFFEENRLGLALTGAIWPENHYKTPDVQCFDFAKGLLDGMFKRLGISVISRACSFVFTQDAMEYVCNQKIVARLGRVDSMQLKRFKIDTAVIFAELYWDVLIELYQKSEVRFSEIPKFPIVRRDLALLVDHQVEFAQLKNIAHKTEKKLLQKVGLFDVYTGDKLPQGKKSYAISFTFRSNEKTLNDQEIDQLMQKLIDAYAKEAGAVLR